MFSLGDWELRNTDFSRKIKTPDWCIVYCTFRLAMTEGESGGVSKLGWHGNLIPEFDKKFVIFRNEKKKEKKDR